MNKMDEYVDELFNIEANLEKQTNITDLRSWQIKAKKFFYENNKNVIFEVSTGAGKTFITIDILQELLLKEPKLKVLIVVPKNVILEEGWYKELVDYGIPIQSIGVYYGSIKEYSRITITNIQNLDRIPLTMFDMFIGDELHNLGTDRILKILETPFKYKIGLTATLARADKNHRKLLELFDFNIYKYNPSEALEDGVLNPFVFYNIGVVLDQDTRDKYDDIKQQLYVVYNTGGGFEKIMKTNTPLKMKMLALINEQKELVNNYVDKIDITQTIINNHKENKILVFNQYNKQTSKIYWHLLDTNIECRVLHSGIDKKTRERTLIDYRNDKFSVLLVSKVLDEGYNLPKLDVAIIMAGDSTDKQTIQRMGRVLRKKKDGYSSLYQLYCVDTIEEKSSLVRAKLFKDLAIDFKEIILKSGEKLQL